MDFSASKNSQYPLSTQQISAEGMKPIKTCLKNRKKESLEKRKTKGQ